MSIARAPSEARGEMRLTPRGVFFACLPLAIVVGLWVGHQFTVTAVR